MTNEKSYSFLDAFNARDDLDSYGTNALLLFVLALRLQLEDIRSVADSALTDSYDDKKCDLVYVDSEDGLAVVAQGYYSQATVPKSSAPANKASDLNTAASWLLNRNISELPEILKPAAAELREGLSSGKINRLEFWYVHNLPESENVGNELASVVETASTAIKTRFPTATVNISAHEFGLNNVEDLYRRLQSPIFVTDEFEIEIPGGYPQAGEGWEAFSTSVSANWLHGVYQAHKEDLFSANVRGYLGNRESDVNINNGIKKSAKERPGDFWAFNNGMTALVHSFEVTMPDSSDEKGILKFKGMSIVNGAQTTGAIGSLEQAPDEKANIPARFVKSSNQGLIEEVIRFNNSQNRIEAADFRSNDPVQTRLRREFEALSHVEYLGGRRGGAEDVIRRRPRLIPSYTVAQALTAFHDSPILAYNGKSSIWTSNSAYPKIFNDDTHSDHMLLVYSLLNTVSDLKADLASKDKAGEPLTETEKEKLQFLRLRGSNYLLVAAVSACLEMVLDRPIASKFDLRFVRELTYDAYKATWLPIVESAVAFHGQLKTPLVNSLRSSSEVDTAIGLLKSLTDATKHVNREVYKSFADKVLSSPRTGT